ncbi:hypothetical protein OTK49_21370 [Vibrio coralliirubri]|uniref:hypothetical protein n=1 Tax=Vibrio coralliirubri TaxID=1516159 RepID=UPI002283F53D|nr:hypothetical protein [Vibrio coralliirubri]MCY9865072.1 hypothetical protein [Vibrio coralliirubri]
MNTRNEINALIGALSLAQDSLMDKAQKLGSKAMTFHKDAQTLIDSLRGVSFSDSGETTRTLNDLCRLSKAVDQSVDLLQDIAAS